jgi:hypothetical protein
LPVFPIAVVNFVAISGDETWVTNPIMIGRSRRVNFLV